MALTNEQIEKIKRQERLVTLQNRALSQEGIVDSPEARAADPNRFQFHTQLESNPDVAALYADARSKGFTGADNVGDALAFLQSYTDISKQAGQAGVDTSNKTVQQISDEVTGNAGKSAAFNQVAADTERTAESIAAEEEAMRAAQEGPASGQRPGDRLSPAEAFAKRNPQKAREKTRLSPAEAWAKRNPEKAAERASEQQIQQNLDIIRDPVTGNMYARDLSIPGSTYKPYSGVPSGSSNSIAPVNQATTRNPSTAQPVTVEDVLESYGFAVTGDAAKQFKIAPVKSFKEVYESVYDSIGLGDVKKNIDKTLKEVQKLDQELADKIADVNENPWLSEGVRTREIQKLQDRYELKRAPFASNLTTFQELYNNGREEARYIATETLQQYNQERQFQMDQIEYMVEQAEKAYEARAAANEKSKPVQVSAGATLIDPDTGQVIFQAPRAASSGSGSSTPGTQEERYQVNINKARSLFSTGTRIPGTDSVPFVDSNGFATPQGFKTVMAAAGIPRDKFIQEFGYLIYTDTNPKTGAVTVPAAYGLTPSEKKLIGAT